jgi:CTP:phosphocholine cytidylyltransferase-like protein
MNIQAEKLEIMRMILETDNPKIITSIKKIFNKSAEKDFWETISQSQKKDILMGIKEIENGDIVDYDDFISKHQ